jgi:hypothetical protein
MSRRDAAAVLAGLAAPLALAAILVPFRGSFPNTDAALALILVVVAVTEIAVWGRRQHAAASCRAGYPDGIHAAAQAVALADQVGAALATSHPAGQG